MEIPVRVFDCPNHDKIKAPLLEMIDAVQSGSVANRAAKLTATDWESPKDTPREYWDFFYNGVRPVLDQVMRADFHDPHWRLDNYWFQQYNAGDWHYWHRHPATVWNCVYYLELPEGVPGTIFVDHETNQPQETGVKEGQIIVFPSQALHCSPEFEEGRKTVIAWNLI